MFFSYKIIFHMTLITGSLITISSNSWMSMWMGMEINLLAFIPLMQNKFDKMSSESSMKYFITQVLASMILLFTLIFMAKNLMNIKNIEYFIMLILNSALLTKMGMPPFHFWFPEVIDGLSWYNCFLLLTWQKLAPMIIVMYNMNNQYFSNFIILFSLIISGILGINQTSLRKLLAYSSMNHMSWMISAMFFSETIWLYYFLIYSILSINIILILKLNMIFYYHQIFSSLNSNFLMKFLFSMNFLSLGGLPPFIGFFPKWITIQSLVILNHLLLSFLMVMTTLFTLFFYVRLIYSILIISNNELNYQPKNLSNNFFIVFFNILTLQSLLLLNFLI